MELMINLIRLQVILMGLNNRNQFRLEKKQYYKTIKINDYLTSLFLMIVIFMVTLAIVLDRTNLINK